MMRITIVLVTICLLWSCGSNNAVSGDDLFNEGKYTEAINAYTDFLTNSPDHTKSLYNRGRAYEELGQADKAMDDFLKVIAIDGKNINACLSLAKLSYNDRDYNKVLVYSRRAIELNENSAQAHFLSARAAHQLGYHDQALESYSNAITINKDFGEALLYRGALKIGMKKPKSACEDFKLAQILGVSAAKKAINDHCK